jgi:hypothetical protein
VENNIKFLDRLGHKAWFLRQDNRSSARDSNPRLPEHEARRLNCSVILWAAAFVERSVKFTVIFDLGIIDAKVIQFVYYCHQIMYRQEYDF